MHYLVFHDIKRRKQNPPAVSCLQHGSDQEGAVPSDARSLRWDQEGRHACLRYLHCDGTTCTPKRAHSTSTHPCNGCKKTSDDAELFDASSDDSALFIYCRECFYKERAALIGDVRVPFSMRRRPRSKAETVNSPPKASAVSKCFTTLPSPSYCRPSLPISNCFQSFTIFDSCFRDTF